MGERQIDIGNTLFPGQPLWQRVPAHDSDGHALHDFMMLIPKLGKAPQSRQQAVLGELRMAFEGFGEEVVFADLNLKLNLLWVSVKPRQGACLELARVIKAKVPEAVLIANKAEALMGAANAKPRCRFILRLPG